MEQKRLPVFAERFSKLRGEKTQGEFADFLGISRPTVGFYENGSRLPDALVLRQISEKCKVSADWLLGISDAKAQCGDLRQACAFTGLSEEALTSIEELYEQERKLENDDIFSMSDVISKFIVHPCFTPMMEDLQCYFSALYHTALRDGAYGASFNSPEAKELLETLRSKCGKHLHILLECEVPNYYRNNVQHFFSMFLDEISDTIIDGAKKGQREKI